MTIMTPVPTSAAIRVKAASCVFDKPLIENIYRGLVSEVVVGAALGSTWEWHGNWNGWDFTHETGVRLEVKQSARQQTWSKARNRLTTPSFDIAIRPGYFEGDSDYIANSGRIRLAQVYVFAHHPVTDETADHADPSQWVFYVVAGDRLPSTQTISLPKLTKLTAPVSWELLSAEVERVRASLAV